MFIEKYSIVIHEIFLYTSLTNKTKGEQKYMKKKFVAIMMVAAMAASMAACGSDGGSSDTQKGGSSTTTSDVANKDKPLVWFNRQPSNSSTGELDTTALNYNKDYLLCRFRC